MAVGTRSWTPELIAISQRLQDEWEAKKARWREESRVKREEKKWEQQELARLKEQVPPEERRVDPPS
jgi:hypothetical protein